MQAFRFFDPWAELANSNSDEHHKAAKSGLAEPPAPVSSASLASLADLAAMAAAAATSSEAPRRSKPAALATADRTVLFRSDVEEKGVAVVELAHGITRLGVPEFFDEPILLRDGRRLWRFPPAAECAPNQAAALIDHAHYCGAVLIADGRELIVVERWLSCLPAESLCELRRCSTGVVSVLHQRARTRR